MRFAVDCAYRVRRQADLSTPMDNCTFAERHWVALDRALSRILPAAEVRRLRERFARRARALSDVYAPRLMEAARAQHRVDDRVRLEELQHAHQALTAALIVAWNDDGTEKTGPRDPGDFGG